MSGTKKEYIIRPYKNGDEISINKGFNQIFGLNRGMEEWRWKFEDPNESAILLSFNKTGQLITHYAAIKERFQYYGQEMCAGHTVDTYSFRDPAAVSDRIFEKVVRQFFDQYGNSQFFSLLYGFPGTRVLKLGGLRLNYGEALSVPYWVKEINDSTKNKNIKTSDRLDDRKINKLWNRASGRYPVSIIRDASWIRKRYDSHPRFKYLFMKSGRFGIYRCFAVCKVVEETLFLVDLIWDGMSIRDLRRLEGNLVALAKKMDLRKLSMWLSGDVLAEKVFRDCNWIRHEEPQKLHLAIVPLQPNIDRKAAIAHFYLTKGCTDII